MADPSPTPPSTPATLADGPAAVRAYPGAAGRRWLLAVVLLVGLLLAAALTAGIAWRRGAFAPGVLLYAIVDNAAGLAPGTAVRVSGVRVGEVRELALQPDLTVRMSLRVDEALLPALRADARAVLVREQLRVPVVELEPGRAAERLDPNDPRLAFLGKATLTEIAADLRGRLAPILDDVKQLTGTLRQNQGDIAQVVQHAASASAQLAGAATELRLLTAGARQRLDAVGGQTQALLVQGNATVAKVGGLIDQVDRSLGVVNHALPGLLSKADGTLAQLDAVARDTRAISQAAADTLPGVLRRAPPLVDEAQDLLQGVRQSWPVRALLPPPPPATLPIGSTDARALREPPAHALPHATAASAPSTAAR